MDGTITVKTLVGVRYSDLTLPSDAEVKEAEREIKIGSPRFAFLLTMF